MNSEINPYRELPSVDSLLQQLPDEVASQIQLASVQLGGIDAAQWQAPRTYNLSVGYYFD